MRKLYLSILALTISISLIGCNNTTTKQIKSNLLPKTEESEQKFIIMDSVNTPIPPEVKNVQSMPSSSEPQQIPNVNLDKPIIITKMPYSENQRP